MMTLEKPKAAAGSAPSAPPTSYVSSIHVAAAREAVWARLTETGRVQPFYFGTVLDTELRPGAPLRYRTADGKHVFIEGEVLAVEAPRCFEHTFRFTDLPERSSRVRFELTEERGGTRLTVIHEGVEDLPKTFARVEGGWRSILANLASLLVRGRLPLRARLLHGFLGVLLKVLPRRA